MITSPASALAPSRLSGLALAVVFALGSATLAGCGKSLNAESSLKKANAAIAAGDTNTASIELRNAIQAAPSNAQARFNYGKLLLAIGQVGPAEAELRKALELNFDAEQLAEPLLDAVLGSNDVDKLKGVIGTLQLKSPGSQSLAAAILGQAQIGANRLKEADEAFAHALKLDAKNLRARLGIAELQALRGEPKQAITGVQALIQEFPKSARANLLMADLLLSQNQRDATKQALLQTIALAPNDPAALARLVRMQIQDGNAAEAQQRITDLEKIAPGQPATLYLKAALAYYNRDLNSARELITNALKPLPDFAPANLLAAQIALDANEFSLAEQQAKAAIKNVPGTTQGSEILAMVYLRMNAPERAAGVLRPLLEAGVRSQTVLDIAAQIASRTNDLASAQNILSVAASQPNAKEEAKVNLALSRAAAGNNNQAIAELEALTKGAAQDSDPAALALIETLIADKQYDKALTKSAELAQKFPKNPIPHHLTGDVFQLKKDLASARNYYNKALSIVPDFLPSIDALANLDLNLGNKDAARAQYDALIKKEPKNAQALLGLARILAAGAGSPAQALEAHRAARAASPNALEPGLALAQLTMRQGRFGESIALLEEMRQLRPQEPAIQDLLAMSHARAGDRAKAMQVLEEMLKANPSSAAILYRIGDLRASINDSQGAITAFNKAIELQPRAVEARAALANLYSRLGRKTEARALVTQLANEQGQNPTVAVLVGDFQTSEKQYAEAVSAYRRALSQVSSTDVARKLYAALSASGQDQQADELLRSWYERNPQDLSIMMEASTIKMNQQKWKEAVAILGEVVKKQPENVPALNNIAWSLHQLKDKNAKPFAQKANQLDPKSPVVMDTLGNILVDTGEMPKGLEFLRAAVSAAPSVAEYRVHLAKALFKAGDKAGATQEVERVLREQPNDPIIPAARELRKQLAG